MIARKRIISLSVAAIAGIGVVGGVLYWRQDAGPRIDPDDRQARINEQAGDR